MTAGLNKIFCVCALALALFLVLSPLTAAAELAPDNSVSYDTDSVSANKQYRIDYVDAPLQVAAETESIPISIYGAGLCDGFAVQLLYGGDVITSTLTSGDDTLQSAQLPIVPNTTHETEYYELLVCDATGGDTGEHMLLTISAIADAISVSRSFITMESVSCNAAIEIKSNYSWHVSQCTASWLNVTMYGVQGTSLLSIEAAENTGDLRTAMIVLQTDGEQSARATLEVEQLGLADPYSKKTLTDDFTGTSISGTLHSSAVLAVSDFSTDDELYYALCSHDIDQTVLAAYNTQLISDYDTLAFRSPLELTVPLASGSDVQSWQVVYLDMCGSIVSSPAVFKNGRAVASVNNVSAFIVMTGGEQQTEDTSSSDVGGHTAHGLRLVLRIALIALASASGLFVLLYILALVLPKRTLKSADSSVSYYIGTKKLSTASAAFADWVWRTAADITLAVRRKK